MRSILALLVAVGLGVVGWLIWGGAPAGTQIRDAREAAAPVAEPAALPLPELVDVAPPPVADRVADDPVSAKGPDVLRDATAEDDSAGVLIEGTVVVVDEQGVEHREVDGSFEPTIWRGSTGTSGQSIVVVDGRFAVRVPPGAEVGIAEGEFDGRLAHVHPIRLVVEAGTPIVVREADLDAQREEVTVNVEAGTPIVLHAAWSRTVRLHVIDAGTRQELRGVTVVSLENLFYGFAHPGDAGDATRVAVDADSPIDLDARSDEGYVCWEPKLFAMAPGYVWGSIEVDYKRGGEATIELTRGGNLQVRVIGEVPPLLKPGSGVVSHDLQAVLRLRQPIEDALSDLDAMVAETMKTISALTAEQVQEEFPDGKVPTEAEVRDHFARELQEEAQGVLGTLLTEVMPDLDGLTRIEGLEPGRRTVSLERGQNWGKPQMLASAVVDIVAGADAHATLTIEPPRESARRVRLAGNVRFSPAWNSTRLDLNFEPIDVPEATAVDEFELDYGDLRPVAGEPGRFRFDAGEVLPGRFLVKSDIYGCQQIVETGPDGTESAEIVISDPADVVVHTLDDLTGTPIREPVLLWNCKFPEGSTGGMLVDLEWDEARQSWCFRAPSGEVEIDVSVWKIDVYEPLESSLFTVAPGANEITIRLRRATGVVLSFEIDGVKIDWREVKLKSTASGHSVTRSSPSTESGSRSITLEAVDGSQAAVSAAAWSIPDDALTFRVPAPGRWRVTVPPLADYEPVAPFDLVIERGVMVKHAIALRKAR